MKKPTMTLEQVQRAIEAQDSQLEAACQELADEGGEPKIAAAIRAMQSLDVAHEEHSLTNNSIQTIQWRSLLTRKEVVMSNSYGVNPSTGPALSFGATSLSPDALLAYCQSQLGGLDSEIGAGINKQQLQLKERQAVETVQSALEGFGTTGPQDGPHMSTCVDAFDKAIATLDANDPVRAQLEVQRDKMTTDYGYVPPEVRPHIMLRTPDIQTKWSGAHASPPPPLDGGVDPATGVAPAALTNKPQNDAWKGTTDAVGSLVQDIRSNAEIDMLKLQDLVSQRQQAVQLASGMMSKEDQTLEAQAKAIGQ